MFNICILECFAHNSDLFLVDKRLLSSDVFVCNIKTYLSN